MTKLTKKYDPYSDHIRKLQKQDKKGGYSGAYGRITTVQNNTCHLISSPCYNNQTTTQKTLAVLRHTARILNGHKCNTAITRKHTTQRNIKRASGCLCSKMAGRIIIE